MRLLAAIAICCAARSVPATAATLHVPADFPSIQSAMDTAAAGDTVLVAAGDYHENLTITREVVLASESGAASTRILAGPHASAIRCLGMPGGLIEGFTISGGGGSPVDGTLAGGGILCVGAAPLIRANRIIECRVGGTGTASPCVGGGIACLSGSTPLIEDCEIADNELRAMGSEYGAATAGAGLYCDAASGAVARRCVFRGNIARSGGCGGVHSGSAELIVEDSTIEENVGLVGGFGYHGILRRSVVRSNVGSSPYGTGGCAAHGACEIRECLIAANRGGSWIVGGAGGVATWGGPVMIAGNTVVANLAPTVAGIWVHYTDQQIRIERNIVAMNGEAGAGWGIAASPGSLRCNDVWGNAAGDYQYGDPMGGGNFSSDPMFCDASTGDFRIDAGSPCAAEQQPECGLIGALGIGCGVSATESWTWGQLKHRLGTAPR